MVMHDFFRRWQGKWRRGNDLILMYHRVAAPTFNPFGNCVSPERFDDQMAALARSGRVVPLNVIARHPVGRPRQRRIAITFDDGTRDLLDTAKPILERHSLPATLFSLSGYLDLAEQGASSEFFWEALVRIFLHPGALPGELAIRIGDEELHYALMDDAHYDQQTAEQHAGWAFRKTMPTRRHELFCQIWEKCLDLTVQQQVDVVAALSRWAANSAPVDELALPLSAAELVELQGGGAFTIGAHTISHRSLPILNAEEKQSEIVEGKQHLERLLGKSVDGFAYPFGRFDDSVVDRVRNAGLRYACTVERNSVGPDADPYRLPRISVRNMDGAALLSMIDELCAA